MPDFERLRRAAVCRDAWEALLGGDRRSAADQLGRLVRAPSDAPYRTEAAFLLALAQVDKAAADRLRHCDDALELAADSGHPVYAPAAKLLLAAHAAGRGDWSSASWLWEDLTRQNRRGYSSLAWFGLAGLHQRAGRPERVREAMTQAWLTGDPQFAPKAVGWLISYHASNGDTDTVTALAASAFGGWRDGLAVDRATLPDLHAVVGRAMLLQVTDPETALAGAQLLAGVNGIHQEPLTLMLARDLGSQPVPMDGVDLPWFDPYLRNQPDGEGLRRVAYEALAYADSVCGLAAVQYLEGNHGPANSFAKIVHQTGRYEWGPIMTASIRHRMLTVLGAPDDFIPNNWAEPPPA